MINFPIFIVFAQLNRNKPFLIFEKKQPVISVQLSIPYPGSSEGSTVPLRRLPVLIGNESPERKFEIITGNLAQKTYVLKFSELLN